MVEYLLLSIILIILFFHTISSPLKYDIVKGIKKSFLYF